MPIVNRTAKDITLQVNDILGKGKSIMKVPVISNDSYNFRELSDDNIACPKLLNVVQ